MFKIKKIKKNSVSFSSVNGPLSLYHLAQHCLSHPCNCNKQLQCPAHLTFAHLTTYFLGPFQKTSLFRQQATNQFLDDKCCSLILCVIQNVKNYFLFQNVKCFFIIVLPGVWNIYPTNPQKKYSAERML